MNLEIILIAALLGLLGATATYIKGRSDGGTLVASEYIQRDLVAEKTNASAYRALSEKYRSQESQWQKSLTAISTDYQGRLKTNEDTLRTVVASNVRLRDPDTVGQACGNSAAAASGSSGGRDGGSGSELSAKATSFLLSEASRADGLTIQLAACQAILRKERE